MNIGEKLKSLREYYGFSQSEISRRLGVPQNNISHYEKQKEPRGLLDYIFKFCELVNMSVPEFFIQDINELKKELPDYIKPEQAALLKILNTQVDIKTRIQVTRAFIELMKSVLIKDEDRLKHLPEYQFLFGTTYQQPEENISSGLKVADK